MSAFYISVNLLYDLCILNWFTCIRISCIYHPPKQKQGSNKEEKLIRGNSYEHNANILIITTYANHNNHTLNKQQLNKKKKCIFCMRKFCILFHLLSIRNFSILKISIIIYKYLDLKTKIKHRGFSMFLVSPEIFFKKQIY